MKKAATALALLALLALPVLTAAEPAAAAPADVASFLAALAEPAVEAPAAEGPLPAPTFVQTIFCTSHSQCPQGQLCCYPCGVPDCSNICMTPVRGRCPLIP